MPLRLFWFEMEVSIIWRYKYTTSQRRCQVFRGLFYKSSSNKSDTTESEEVFLYWWYLSTNSLVLVTIFTADYHRITRCQFFVYKKLGVCRQGVNFLLTKNWHLVDRRRKRFSILLQKDEKKKIICQTLDIAFWILYICNVIIYTDFTFNLESTERYSPLRFLFPCTS